MDHYLASIFKHKSGGKFIEVGANDGLTQSNTYYLEFYMNWKGILVEPIPELFEKCVENRSAASVCVNCALVSNDYPDKQLELIYTPESNGLLSCVNNKKAEKLMKRTTEKGLIISVPTYSLNDILFINKCKFGNHYDLMSLDVEGYEAEVLKGIDFKNWVIDYILVEELETENNIGTILEPFYDKVDKLGVHDYLYKRKCA